MHIEIEATEAGNTTEAFGVSAKVISGIVGVRVVIVVITDAIATAAHIIVVEISCVHVGIRNTRSMIQVRIRARVEPTSTERHVFVNSLI